MGRRLLVSVFIIAACMMCSSCEKLFKVTEKVSENVEVSLMPVNKKEPEKVLSTELKIAACDAKTLNPYSEKSPITKQTLRLLYEPLFGYDENMRIIPYLAESWSVSDNGKQIQIKVKNNVKWHDGKPLTANDVLYTVNMIMSTGNSLGISNARVINRDTLSIAFYKPQISCIESLMFPVIKKAEGNPVGTGPFKFDGKVSTDVYALSAFDEYHGQKPEINSVRIINCPNEASVIRMFDIGEIDVLTSGAFDYSSFNVNSNMNVYDYPTNELAYMGINFNNSIFWGESTRQALMYILDKKDIVSKTMYKKAEPTDFPVNPKSFLYNRELGYDKNNLKAEELLLRDSWTRVDGVFARMIDGVKQNFKIKMLVADTEELKDVAESIKQTMMNFGIECDVIQKSGVEFASDLQSKNYDVFIDKIKLSGSADFEGLTGEGNIFGYLNSELNSLTEQIRLEKDEEKLKAMYSECFKIFLKDSQFIPLFFYKDAVATNSNISVDIIPLIQGMDINEKCN